MVFEGGLPGLRKEIPGEYVQGEIEELLGGPIVWEELTKHLHLVTRADADDEGLLVQYGIYRSGRAEALIRGDAVVVKIGHGGGAQDIKLEDVETAELLVRPYG